MVLRVAALLLLATVVDGRGRAGKPGGTKKDPEANNHLQQVRLSLVPVVARPGCLLLRLEGHSVLASGSAS